MGPTSLLEALRSPQCYGHPVDRVEVIETHISLVVLAGAFAYKIKKPVSLPFLDFSSLAARRHFCDEEFRLNQRTAPDIYLGVVPICGSVEAPRVGGVGEPIEFAVKMRRFPQETLLDRLASAGTLDARTIEALALEVAQLHAVARRAGPGSEYGSPESVLRNAFENFRQVESLHDAGTKASIPPELYGWTLDQHHALADLMALRKHEGFVREGHGDLHLGNIVLFEGRPAIFDCIEFSPQLRWLDVMSDVAFVMMDLLQHRRPELAWRFLDAYLGHTGDYAGLAVLRFYLVYRAMVRAKIACIRRAHESFASYLDLATELTRTTKQALVIMHGVSGSGKTTISRSLVESLPAIRLRSDVERKRVYGFEELARTGASPGAGIYTASATERTYERLAALGRDLLRHGYSVIVDATFLARAHRRRFEAIAAAAGVPFAIVDCVAPGNVLSSRLVKRHHDASEAGIAVLERQRDTQQPLDDDEWMASIVCDTSLEGCERDVARALDRRINRGESGPCVTTTSSTATPTESARFIS
jgi:aminoglycoside phosphotransferase family enzyme/predicted kinase